MNHSTIIRRALEITWRNPVLWLFGFLVAVSGGGGGSGGLQWTFSGSGGGGGGAAAQPGRPLDWDGLLATPNLPPALRRFLETLRDEVMRYRWEELAPTLLTLVAALVCCLAVLFVVMMILRYIARVALIRGVDQIEATGTAPTWREGFGLGWSHRTFRLFALDLIVFAVVAFCVGAAVAMAVVPIVVGAAGAPVLSPAIGLGVLMLCCLAPFAAVVFIALGILGEIWAREIALADRGIGDALTEGYQRLREQVVDFGLLWLILLLVGFIYAVIVVFTFIAVLLIAGSVAVGIGYLVFALSASALWAIAIGAAAFLLGMMIPMALVGGLWEVFRSSVWTLAWRVPALPAPPTAPSPAG